MNDLTNNKPDEGAATINKIDDVADNHKQSVIPEQDQETPAPSDITVPNFEALAVLDNSFSENANPPPMLDAEAPRSTLRGRPSLSAEERAARKKQRDAEYRAKKTGKPAPAAQVLPAANTPPTAEAVATAEMVVATLDMVLQTASGGEFEPIAAARAGMVTAWSKYLHQTGKELPVWAEVSIMTAVYVLPIMRSPTLKERCIYAYARAKAFLRM